MKKNLIRLLRKLNWLKYFNLTITQTKNGKTIIVPVIKSLGHDNLQLSELWMCDVMRLLLNIKKGTFIDVGVNVGQTLIKLKLVDETVEYIGFDPNVVCIFYAKELIKANDFLNTTLVPVGISDRTEIVTLNFYIDGDSDSSASIVKDFRPAKVYRQEHVACYEYEQLRSIMDVESLSIIKIDVEGAELQVLQGLKKLLEAKRPFLLIEILPVYSAENVERLKRQETIESMMINLNYKALRIVKEKGNFKNFQLVEIIGISSKIEESDYLLCPSELLHYITHQS